MKISKLELENFRNYDNLTLQFDSDVSVLYGENGQGKTNILEAVYLCSCLRSHRTSKDTDLIFHDKDEYRISLEYFDDDTAGITPLFMENISIVYQEANIKDPGRLKNRRILKHNDMALSKASDVLGLFNAVIFAPEDLYMIKEGPSTRRRFVDILISQIRPMYFNELNIFQRILSQRNSLLKQMRDRQIDRDYGQLAVWDISLAGTCAKIISTRIDFTKKICEIASRCHREISSGKEEIYVKYKTISGIDMNNSVEEIKDIIFEKLKTNFYEDIEKGNTTYGPHRDDLEITINGEIIRSFASQGQQRTAVLALKIAELEIIRSETGSYPVLLLDDVMSELDEKRRKTLLKSIGDAQVILTCTVKAHVAHEFLEENPGRTIKYYEVDAGRIL